ncbi:DUF7857 domain-containing protein [Halomarina ordinaria]|uniref:DUF8080 domain-containing protein n=1 Tax=Halomarina ordinaria TaxID=3033939 RepID=A0ABD5UD64_9EURY|nr:hypothetical protein [Halomarina sp. PSRA2]
MDVDCTQHRDGGVTFVSVVLRSDRPRRVELDPAYDRVWPPRRNGVPAKGWADGQFTGRVEGTRAVGFATPEPPAEGCVEVAWAPPGETAPAFGRPDWAPEVTATPDGVVRALSDPRPPRGAVPEPSNARGVERDPASGECADPVADDALADERSSEGAVLDVAGGDALAAIEARVAAAERLAGADSLAEATEALERVGGLAGARALRAALAADRERLAASVAEERAATLHERAGVEVPVDTLERLA